MNNSLSDKIQVSLDIHQQQKQAEDSPPSPTFGGVKNQKQKPSSLQGMQKVGKHGKSHHEYLKVMNKHQTTEEFRKICMEELAFHNNQQSAWLALNGVVYDVTVYLKYHPGGDILLKGCGKQCDKLFNQYHPWVNGKYLLEKYKIGFL